MQFLPIHFDLKFNPKTFSADDMKNIPDNMLHFIYVIWDTEEKAAYVNSYFPFSKFDEKEFEEDIRNLTKGYAQINGKNLQGKIYGFRFDGVKWKPQIYEFKRFSWSRIEDKKILIGDPNFIHNFMEGFLTLKVENML